MSDKSTVEKERRGEPTDAVIEVVIAAERQRCIDRVLTYGALAAHCPPRANKEPAREAAAMACITRYFGVPTRRWSVSARRTCRRLRTRTKSGSSAMLP